MHWDQAVPRPGLPEGRHAAPRRMRGRGAPGAPIGARSSRSRCRRTAGRDLGRDQQRLIKLTRDDGKTWDDVTIPDLPVPGRGDRFPGIEASHFDPAAAYSAVDFHGTGDYKPYFFGRVTTAKTGTAIVHGLPRDLPSGSFARVIRGDTKQAALLFRGHGERDVRLVRRRRDWQVAAAQSPQHVVSRPRDSRQRPGGRHLRPRHLGARRLFAAAPDHGRPRRPTRCICSRPGSRARAPQTWARTRRSPEVPHALNPPDGAIIYYLSASQPAGEIALDVLDAGRYGFVRHLSSAAVARSRKPRKPPEPNSGSPRRSRCPLRSAQPRELGICVPRLRRRSPTRSRSTRNPGQTPPVARGAARAPGRTR